MDRSVPNVVIVITDDQGYGDLSCTGNSWLDTPNIDRFSSDSVRLTDFHVSPLCAPTSGAPLTGRNPLRNGVWATTWGRSLLSKAEVTLADAFQANGYRTGMFGKWHLGDNYPYRPQDRGFETVVAHKGGRVGQTPDFWGNSYFDDTYFHNGEAVDHTGYCTDVWFAEATGFIEEHHQEPFFCYLATNAPHAPYLVEDRYADPFRGNSAVPEPEFAGMIVNIDENFGRLSDTLRRLELEENTILIFMTDNGTSGGCTVDATGHVVTGYNAFMRGKKGSYYEGGHRVPFFLRWPAASLEGGKDVTELLAHVDVFPTLAELCDLDLEDSSRFDGVSFAELLHRQNAAESPTVFAERPVFVQYRQHTEPPLKLENAVLQDRWRLVAGEELYDITEDPSQTRDLAASVPEHVRTMRGFHERWWSEVSPGLSEYQRITVGSDHENPCRLDAFDLMGDSAWNQTHIREALRVCGRWNLLVDQDGDYELTLRRWPEEAGVQSGDAPEDGG